MFSSVSRTFLRSSPAVFRQTNVASVTAVGVRPFSWSSDFSAATAELKSTSVTFLESADRLRALCKTDLVKATDLRDDPIRFFEAHKLLARHAVTHGPGFWIRFTVHYNLFGGTILAVGNPQQVEALADYQKKGQLGCFSLTEKLAGVQSGLVVQTEATYDPATGGFVLHTPSVGARKNWISQGFVADKTVVLADLIIAGERKGPHAFVMDFRRDGQLVPGITIDDMGPKTTGNDLDNAWIQFDKVKLPAGSLLNRYSDVVDGKYVVKVPGIRPFDMIGQRLYTGRVAVAQAALEYRRTLFRKTKEYSDQKKVFSFKGDAFLSGIPQLNAIYKENDKKLAELDAFVGACEKALADCLTKSETPSNRLVDAIATCKVRCVEQSIEMCFRLKQEVGSFALMDDAGFKHMDFLQCCKFAEGDSRILSQKMARDALKTFAAKKGEGMSDEEKRLCTLINANMAAEAKKNGGDKLAAWDAEWENIYKLADAFMNRVQKEGV